MATTLQHDLRISGALEAGNFARGSVTITTVANTPTSIAVTGLDLQGEGDVFAWVTANTTVPGTRVIEVSFSDPTPNGMTVWVYRNNVYPTILRWMMARKRT